MKKTHNTAFIVELLLLFVLLLLVIIVITQTFMAARGKSLYAKHLTEAVCLAEAVAEVSMSAPDEDAALSLLREMEQVKDAAKEQGQIVLEMDFADALSNKDDYRVTLVWDEENAEAGAFVNGEIRVFYGGDADPLYTLTTGDYRAG